MGKTVLLKDLKF